MPNDSENVDETIFDELAKQGIVDAETLNERCRASDNTLESYDTQLTFPARIGCSFGTDPNLEPKDQYLQAREVTSQPINGPSKGVICNIRVQTPTNAEVRFDDYLFITVADIVVIGSNTQASSYLPQSQGFYKWDFGVLRGNNVSNIQDSPYCLGGSDACVVPPHDQQGPLNISMESTNVAPLAYGLAGWKTFDVKVIATGDNDETDCQHSQIDLTVSVDFIQL
ncbi:hypothetical protein [Pseudobacteriovorax antillogorgiicola]|uniref:Uncharacterized protein n=1 Tax=Pseudobacteriovorax antillogorgiicola TaxID=1513793 RepID=A0A1Y6BVJ4_9BACT|nr:hypothetical protein [Pseudobacteriovorax antillogorgiicola]TCS52268.1 hypothetical protein EDD56_10912 [Pseudobacteriovorax antillogorgiicola]SMF30911.1 hypothetical protein SAMN06296036_109201 [Pseudobacteriovorax antillogorgiicola]